MTAREWRLELPWSTPPLSANSRGHWRTTARRTRDVRDVGAYAARAAGIPQLERIALELHYRPRDRRRRDPRNLAPTLKALEDGLVDAGVVPDDTPTYVDGSRQELYVDEPAGFAELYLVVREVLPPPPPPFALPPGWVADLLPFPEGAT